ncbi:GATA zinc finger domain-containing protein 10-like [Rhopalosiphum padi]|uniref:GATA zinc finger domain-containing protein 10-like n=1 Tax=Rhopalosiphum padi TaxID=40932 RepID=UPI00298E6D17|nr:GATA zinc finger domain-containing protein 10-like [Rhopalosiphum padi]
MSVPMELDDPATEAVPLDLTVKKENDSASSAAVKKRDGPAEESAGDAPPPSNGQNGGKPTPLDLSAGRTLSSQAPPPPPPPPPSSANVAQRATVVVLSPKVQVAPPPPPSPPPKSKPPCKGYWTPDSSSPLMPEHLAPLHGIYADAAAYRHMISSATVPEYNPFLPVLPPSAQFHHHNHFQQQQQQHLHIQQQHQLHLQQQLQLQLQMQQQQQHHQEQQQKLQKQKLQLQAAYGGLPIDPTLLLTGSPVYAATSSPSSSESNHFPFGGFDCGFSKPPFGFGYPYYERMLDGRVIGGACGGIDISANRSDCPSPESTTTCTTTTDDHHHFNHHHHQQQQQRDLDREHHHRIKACDMDDLDVVDPEEVAAIYRQSDFLSFRHRYMESLGPPRNFEKMRRSSNNNNNNSSSSSNNNDDHRMTSGQQQYDQTYVMKRQKNNEAAKRSRDAKRQKYIENQISVMYLTKKVSEMKDIKRRLLKSM